MKIFGKAVALVIGLYASTAYAGVPNWSVSELNGSVTVVRGEGTKVAANRGTVLRPGDTIFTGAKSRAVIVRKQEFVILAENSRIVAALPTAGSMVQIVQKGGNAVYKIKKKTTPHFSVQTPYLAAVVKGTTFSVNVTGSGASVQVIEGRVQVVANDGAADHLLTPGKIGLVDAKSPNRLTIQGDGNDIVVESPAVATDFTPSSPPSETVVDDVPTEQTTILADVSEGAIRLEDLTDGMVTGDSSLRALTRIAQLGSENQPVNDEPNDLGAPVIDGSEAGGGDDGDDGDNGDNGSVDDGINADEGSGGSGAGSGGTGSNSDTGNSGSGGSDTGAGGGSGSGEDRGDDDDGGSGSGEDKGDDDDGGKGGKDDDDKGGNGGKGGKGGKDDDDKGGKGGKDDDDKGGKGGKDDDDKGGKGGKGGKEDDDKGGKGGRGDDDDKGGKGGKGDDDDKGGKGGKDDDDKGGKGGKGGKEDDD